MNGANLSARIETPRLISRRWQFALIAISTVVLCSCRHAPRGQIAQPPCPAPTQGMIGQGGMLPPQAYAGAPYQQVPGAAPWRPSGISRPWPKDEYIHDGGDANDNVKVNHEFRVFGLEQGDTIAHYDTVDGQRKVQPSNRVDIYAPRFASVRKVSNLSAHERHLRPAGNALNARINLHEENQLATTTIQPIQANRQIGSKSAVIHRGRQFGGTMSRNQGTAGLQDALMPHENFQLVKTGTYEQLEKAQLAISVDSAITWSHDTAVQVVIDKQNAHALVGDQRAQATFGFKETGTPQLRIVKMASTKAAKPGEFIDFTLRFDNVGTQTIGNVTVIDNLVTRLAYVPDSQKSTIKADFLTERNNGDTLVLRWEITDPIPAGKGGVIRFRCKVR